MRLKIFVIATCMACCLNRGFAQDISADSLKNIVKLYISHEYPEFFRENTSSGDESYFYIEDIITRQQIAEKKYGIFEFGLFGDDLGSWIMWYDSSGYKIYSQFLDVNMLSDMLEFCKRNHFSELKTMEYIRSLYKVSLDRESIGEKEVKPIFKNKDEGGATLCWLPAISTRSDFYCVDIVSREPFAESRFGIYEFGLSGDIRLQWLLYYDETGYRIYKQGLNTEMLGEILTFCGRNHLPEYKSYRYLLGISDFLQQRDKK